MKISLTVGRRGKGHILCNLYWHVPPYPTPPPPHTHTHTHPHQGFLFFPLGLFWLENECKQSHIIFKGLQESADIFVFSSPNVQTNWTVAIFLFRYFVWNYLFCNLDCKCSRENLLLQEKFKNAKYLFGEMSLPSLNLKKWAPGILLPEMGSEDTPVLKISWEKLLSYYFFYVILQ